MHLTIRQAHVPVIRDYDTSKHQVLVRLVNPERCGEYVGVSINSVPSRAIATNSPIIFLDDKEKIFGCIEYHWRDKVRIFSNILLVSRGRCSFHDKLIFAKRAGAKAVIILNNQPGRVPHVTVPKVMIPGVLLSQEDSLAIVDGSLTFASITPLKSINEDIDASFRLLYRDQRIKNAHIVNV
ncbi:hypothetical protein K501DRAFT_260696 [Backusella circina FSU 941]|nr:hypothetical protein K501DRAFT_260696 [Backusella circina FSU 941]